MEITRRVFSRGLSGVFGSAFVPGGTAVAKVLPIEPGIDDAYEKLLSEYIRIEEAAIATGRATSAHGGAITWEGRQLEGFIAELDGRVDLKTTARQIYSEFKERFRAEAQKLRDRLKEKADTAFDDEAACAEPVQTGAAVDHVCEDRLVGAANEPTREIEPGLPLVAEKDVSVHLDRNEGCDVAAS